jgi:hypothetical protein
MTYSFSDPFFVAKTDPYMHCLEESESDILGRELRQLAQRSESM